MVGVLVPLSRPSPALHSLPRKEDRSMRLTSAQKMMIYRNRMKALGLKAVTVYVHPEDVSAIKSFAELQCEKRGIDKTPQK